MLVLLQPGSSRCPGPLGGGVSGWCRLNALQILLQICLEVALLLALPMLVDQAWRVLFVAQAPLSARLARAARRTGAVAEGRRPEKKETP